VTIVVGADIQAIDEVRESAERFGQRYLERIYTRAEIEECTSRAGDVASALARRFAAKEAVFKILSTENVALPWKDVEIRCPERGNPVVILHGRANVLARNQGIRALFLRFSQGNGVAAAVVVAES
jgi:holo-[acyl-carrier protein] synthase